MQEARINAVLNGLGDHLVKSTASFKDCKRRLEWWDKVGSFPALFLRLTGVEYDWTGNGLQKRTLEAEIWFYDEVGESTVPSERMVTLQTEIQCALAPDDADNGEFTLGGTVEWCRIEGKADLDSGDMDKYIKGIVPLRILLP